MAMRRSLMMAGLLSFLILVIVGGWAGMVSAEGVNPYIAGSTVAGGSSPTQVERTGSITTIGSDSNSGSQSVTVPSDAEFCVVAVSGYGFGSALYAPAGGTLTLGGNSMTMSYCPVDYEVGVQNAAIWTLLNLPSSGSQTLAWDWDGTATPSEGQNINVAFYKGVADSDPVKDSGGAVGNSTAQKTTGAMDSATDDLVVCIGDTYTGGSLTWSANVSVNAGPTTYNSNTFELAEGTPSGATITVTMQSTDTYNVVACIVIDH